MFSQPPKLYLTNKTAMLSARASMEPITKLVNLWFHCARDLGRMNCWFGKFHQFCRSLERISQLKLKGRDTNISDVGHQFFLFRRIWAFYVHGIALNLACFGEWVEFTLSLLWYVTKGKGYKNFVSYNCCFEISILIISPTSPTTA